MWDARVKHRTALEQGFLPERVLMHHSFHLSVGIYHVYLFIHIYLLDTYYVLGVSR